MADALKLEQPWEQVKERIKETKVELTDEDLDYTPGNEEAMIQRLSKKISKSPEETKEWIESISSNKGKAG